MSLYWSWWTGGHQLSGPITHSSLLLCHSFASSLHPPVIKRSAFVVVQENEILAFCDTAGVGDDFHKVLVFVFVSQPSLVEPVHDSTYLFFDLFNTKSIFKSRAFLCVGYWQLLCATVTVFHQQVLQGSFYRGWKSSNWHFDVETRVQLKI